MTQWNKSNRPTLVGFTIQLNLIGLHHLLNCLSDVTQTHIDASILQQKGAINTSAVAGHQSEMCVCVDHTLIPLLVASLTASSSLSYFGLNVTVKAQSMIRPAETPRGHQNTTATSSGTSCHHTLHTVDVCPKINLADVVVLQDCGVPSIRSVVGSTVVEGAASGEGQASVQPVLLDQLTGAAFQSLAWETNDVKNVNQRTSAEPNQTPSSDLQRCSFHSSLTRCQSWSDRVWWSCGRAAGPVCGPQPPVWSRSTSPRWLCPAPVAPRCSFATLHCGWKNNIFNASANFTELQVETVKTSRTKVLNEQHMNRCVFHLTRPAGADIHTPVPRGTFHRGRAHRLAQMVDQSEI